MLLILLFFQEKGDGKRRPGRIVLSLTIISIRDQDERACFFFLRAGPRIVNAMRRRRMMEIGLLKKNEILPLESITALLNSPSAIGPRMIPRIIEGAEYPQRFIR